MTKSLPCPTCKAPIDLPSAKWCDCLSKKLTIVCPSCHACFCKLLRFPMEVEWAGALRDLLEQQTAEKFRRALGATTPANKGQTVLIVDDDEEIRLIAEYTLQQMGYQTLIAADAQEGLAMVENFRIDIVLTDALMPKVDGRQFCRLIKLQHPSIKVIVMSALYTSSRYRIEALHEFHADEYLAKPIHFGRLHDVLEKLSVQAA